MFSNVLGSDELQDGLSVHAGEIFVAGEDKIILGNGFRREHIPQYRKDGSAVFLIVKKALFWIFSCVAHDRLHQRGVSGHLEGKKGGKKGAEFPHWTKSFGSRLEQFAMFDEPVSRSDPSWNGERKEKDPGKPFIQT